MNKVINDISELTSKESFYLEKIDEICNQRNELVAGLCECFFTYIINKAGIATEPKDLLVEYCSCHGIGEGYANIQFSTSYLEDIDNERKFSALITHINMNSIITDFGPNFGPDVQEFLRSYMFNFVKSIVFKRSFFVCFTINLFTIENANIIAEHLSNIKKELDKLSDFAPCGFSFEI